MQYKNPENRELVLEGLKMTGRMDLVGFGPKCLIRPIREKQEKKNRHPLSLMRIMTNTKAVVKKE